MLHLRLVPLFPGFGQGSADVCELCVLVPVLVDPIVAVVDKSVDLRLESFRVGVVLVAFRLGICKDDTNGVRSDASSLEEADDKDKDVDDRDTERIGGEDVGHGEGQEEGDERRVVIHVRRHGDRHRVVCVCIVVPIRIKRVTVK